MNCPKCKDSKLIVYKSERFSITWNCPCVYKDKLNAQKMRLLVNLDDGVYDLCDKYDTPDVEQYKLYPKFTRDTFFDLKD